MTYAAVSTVSRAALCALLGLCFLAGLLPRAVATGLTPTFTVTHTADDTLPGSLRAAITQAAAVNGTVNFQIPASDPGVSGGTATITLSLGPLVVPSSLSIVGPNSPSGAIVVSGGASPNQSRVFSVTGGTVSISNLTITNGLAPADVTAQSGDGGGVLNTANLTLSNCIVTGNSANNAGGGVCNLGGTLTLAGSAINGNGSGASGGGVYSNNGNLTLSLCTVTGNNVPNGRGGGIASNGDTLTVNGCTVSGNTTGNQVNGGGTGGGLFAQSTMQMTNTTISGNTEYGPNGGGGIRFGLGSFTMTNCFVLDNNAVAARVGLPFGGGILISGTQFSPTPSLLLTNCVIADNTNRGFGAGITTQNATTTAINCTFTGNYSPISVGAAIAMFSSTVTLTNDILYDDVGLTSIQPESAEIADLGGTSSPSTIAVTYTDLEQTSGVYPGAGNINADPLFVRNASPTATPPDNGDEHLRFNSPAIHTGTNGNGVPVTDIEGTPRPTPPATPSMGAYEVSGAASFNAQGGFLLTGVQNQSTGTQVVAKFLPGPTPGTSFTATVDFGDGSGPAAAAIVADAATAGVFDVTGSHTYAAYGTFTITVVITGPGGSPTATVTSTATIQPAQTATDVTSQVSVFRGGLVYSRPAKHYLQTVTLTNTGSAAITGPISLVLDNLSSGAAAFNPTGTTQYAPPAGSPYQNATVTSIAPGATVSVIVQITYSGSTPINYTPRVLAGPGAR